MRHDNVVNFFDVFESKIALFMVMELCEGTPGLLLAQ
jgi:hypothetical protein